MSTQPQHAFIIQAEAALSTFSSICHRQPISNQSQVNWDKHIHVGTDVHYPEVNLGPYVLAIPSAFIRSRKLPFMAVGLANGFIVTSKLAGSLFLDAELP